MLTGSFLKGASYERWIDGTIVDPMVARSGNAHSYSGPNLEPNADLKGANLYSTNLTGAWDVEFSTGYYYPNTTLPSGFNPVVQGWRLAPCCDFNPDAVCDLVDINQMFQAGNLVTGVSVSGSTERLDLADNNTLHASDVTEWLAQAATANGHKSPYLCGDTELDRDVNLTDFNALASHFDPTGDGDPQNGRCGMKAILMATTTPTLPI